MENIARLIEEGKVKRYFRARNKPSFEGAISHITQHASGAEPLFLEESDYLYMLHLMKEKSDRFKFDIFSFVLMPNHIHILLRLNEANLSYAMKILFETYAKYFNNKYDRKGHVFSGAYRSALCFDENYILAASLYIHLNPVKAKLVENAVDYRWSSCALFLGEVKKGTFIDYKFILEMLDADISHARRKYKELLGRFNVEAVGDVWEKPRALQFFAQFLRENKKWERDHGLLGDDDIEKKIEELRNRGNLKGPEERKARGFLIEQLRARGFNATEIANRLNLSRQAVYTYLKQKT